MNRYIKIQGHTNWFLVLMANQKLENEFAINMQEKILRTEVYTLHGGQKVDTTDWDRRVTLAANQTLDYNGLAQKYGTILIRPIGSWMTTLGNEIITDERFDSNFPIDDFAEIVICENDKHAEYNWVEYLKSRFPDQRIITINFFDLRTENEVSQYFSKARFITFSTTFSNYDWFEKLSKVSTALTHKYAIIGYSHDVEKWEDALKINSNVEIVRFIK